MENQLVQGLRTKGLEAYLAKNMAASHALAQINSDKLELVEGVLKAMDRAEAGGGLEFYWTGYSQDLINQIRLDLKVSALFQHVPMPAGVYKLPVEVGPATGYIVPENTADSSQTSITGSNAGTANVTLTATSFGALTRISRELDQDSIVPLVPMIQRNLLRGLANALEDAILNGDTTGTHQDSDVSSSTDARKAFKGLRKHALANSYSYDAGNAAVTITKMRSTRALMGNPYSVNPNDLAWIVGPKVYMQLLGLAEAQTMDKYGPSATILTGELLKIDGIPVIVSPFMRENVNASGVYDGSTTNRATAILVHRNGFVVGDREQIVLDEDDTPKEYRQRKLMAEMRLDFQPAYAIATNPTVAILYNIAV